METHWFRTRTGSLDRMERKQTIVTCLVAFPFSSAFLFKNSFVVLLCFFLLLLSLAIRLSVQRSTLNALVNGIDNKMAFDFRFQQRE